MNECPVCRSPLFGRPDECDECLTPLKGGITSPRSWGQILTLFFPGLGHLWLGKIIFGLFISFLSAVSISFLFNVGSFELGFVRRLILWSFFWLPWAVGWFWQIRSVRRRFVDPSQIAVIFTMLLVMSNMAVFFNLVLLLFRS